MASPQREPAEQRDPFENLRLDEGFVRAARFIEPSAAERGQTADRRDPGRCQVVPANRRLPAGMHRIIWAPRPGIRHRRATRVLAFLAVLAGVISIVVALRHSNNRAGTTATSAPGTARTSPASSAPLAPRTAGGVLVTPTLLSSLRVGQCVTWDLASSASAADVDTVPAKTVPCEQPHRAQVIKIIDDLGWRVPAKWPDVATLDSLATTHCGAAFNSYVGSTRAGLSPVAGALEPGPEAWAEGLKKLACTVQLPDLALVSGPLAAATTPA